MAVALGLSLSAMAYLTDGSQSPYFSGVNLVILGFAAVNTFYYKHNLIVSLAQFLIYNAAMLLSDAPFDLTNFIFSNNFLLATSLFVVLLTKFAGQQHFNAFIHNEDLKVKEHQLSSLYRQAAKLARTDDLTKLYNRRHFFDILKNRVKVSENHGLNFYLVLVDVDHFKELNDTFGHPKGDEILIKVAKTLKDNLRPGDFLGRYGGDEFMIIFDGSNNKSLTKRMTDINNKLQNEEVCDEKTGHTISLTFGASLFSPNQALDEEDIFRRADKQLYKAKESQRGSISID